MKKRVLTALVGIPVLILGVFFAPIWLFGVIIAVICGFVAFELMRCAIGQAPKRLYISSILSAVAIAIFGGLDLRMAAIILLFLFFVLSCEMMACFSTPRKISMEMVAISMLAGGVLPMMLSTLLRIAQFETTISIPELLNGNSTLVRITHDGIVGRVRAFLPFVGPIVDQAGQVHVAADVALTPQEIILMDYLAGNVIGRIPSMDELNDVAKGLVSLQGIRAATKE